jgi:hypothetical protein
VAPSHDDAEIWRRELFYRIEIGGCDAALLIQKIYSFADLSLQSESVSEPSSREILEREANTSENRDLLLVFTAMP